MPCSAQMRHITDGSAVLPGGSAAHSPLAVFTGDIAAIFVSLVIIHLSPLFLSSLSRIVFTLSEIIEFLSSQILRSYAVLSEIVYHIERCTDAHALPARVTDIFIFYSVPAMRRSTELRATAVIGNSSSPSSSKPRIVISNDSRSVRSRCL